MAQQTNHHWWSKKMNPKLAVSAALMPEGAYQGDFNVSGSDSNSFALVHYGQSFRAAASLYDYVCPMLYTGDFGASGQWAAALVENTVDAGNRVIAGLQSFSPSTSEMLRQDIDAISPLFSGKMKGIALFRNGMFNYVKTTVNAKNGTMSVKIVNARDADYSLGYAKIELQDGLMITGITGLSGGLSGADAEISEDGKNATFTVSGAEEGTADVRNYQITIKE